MNRIRIRGPPGGRLDEAMTSLIARFLLSFIQFTKENTSMTIRPIPFDHSGRTFRNVEDAGRPTCPTHSS